MLGREYYPKLQACVPFTPCTGPRLMVAGDLAPAQRRRVLLAMGRGLIKVAESSKLSSVHVTFNTAEEWAALSEVGFLQRTGIQFHWDNTGYGDFDAFLATLKQSKRKSIRQERKSLTNAGLTIRRLVGSDITPAHWDAFYAFYNDTVDRMGGSAYLTRDFFTRLGKVMPERVLLVVAEEAGGSGARGGGGVVAAALNLAGSHTLFGRNWGCAREVRNLHFELCYYQALDHAIERGLPRVEAGAQGPHKLQRGYMPNITYSSHYIADPRLRALVKNFLARERQQVQMEVQGISLAASPYKEDATLATLMARLSAHVNAVNSSVDDDLS